MHRCRWRSSGSGVVSGAALHAVVSDDGGEDRAGPVALPRQPDVQDGLEVIGGRGLALGAGDAADRELPGGMAIGQVRQQAHGGADVRHPDAGQGAALGIGLLTHVGEGASRRRRGQIGPFEGRSLAEEERPGDHLLGVAGDQFHRPAQIGAEGRLVGQKAVLEEELIIVAQRQARSFHRSVTTNIRLRFPLKHSTRGGKREERSPVSIGSGRSARFPLRSH